MTTATSTRQEIAAGLNTIRAIADAVKELGSVPSGHLYATVMGHLSLNQYEQVIGILTRAELIRKDGDVLRWFA